MRGTLDFALAATDCFSVTYDQPYDTSKTVYETHTNVDPNNEHPPFYTPFPLKDSND